MSLQENTRRQPRPKEQQREADKLAKELFSKGVVLLNDMEAAFRKHFANRADVVVDRQWVTQVRYRIGKKTATALRDSEPVPAKPVPVEGKILQSGPTIRPTEPLFTREELMILTKAVIELKTINSDTQLKLICKLTSTT